MKLRDAWEGYYSATESVSTLAEKLLFGGIGTVLVLSGGLGATTMTINVWLKLALILFVLGFVAAAVQYLARAFEWRRFALRKESSLESEAEHDDASESQGSTEGEPSEITLDTEVGAAPEDINHMSERAFVAKMMLTGAGWLCVVLVFLSRVG